VNGFTSPLREAGVRESGTAAADDFEE
jgi:hypothetical protein